MPRRGENIFKRKDGRWEARYIKGHDLSGKAKYGYCYGRTYTEAREKVNSMKAKKGGTAVAGTAKSRQRFAYYCGKWVEQRRYAVKPSTYAKYVATIENDIIPQLGNQYPSAFTTELVERFKTYLLTERNLSAKTVRDILMVFRMIVVYARKQVPGEIPEFDIIYPREQRKEMRVLSQEEQERLATFLTTDMDCCKFGVYLALTTGIRIGELCALRWRDISLPNGTITISATMQRLRIFEESRESKTVISIDAPKSSTSARTIPLTQNAVTLCKRFAPASGSAFVLTGTDAYMEPRTLQYRFERYAKACGLEDVHFHTLRHTFATRCVEVGFEIKSLSEILGHANTSITLNRYVHSSMKQKKSNMDKLSAAGF
ncbi:MAG: site-specific integrase [Firmicutes bacterium]|nr:site-specific integrase [Bacillota bacterium]